MVLLHDCKNRWAKKYYTFDIQYIGSVVIHKLNMSRCHIILVTLQTYIPSGMFLLTYLNFQKLYLYEYIIIKSMISERVP